MEQNKYLIFAGKRYYPLGGYEDLISYRNTINECKEFITSDAEKYEWCHIVDEGHQVIMRGKRIDAYMGMHFICRWEWCDDK